MGPRQHERSRARRAAMQVLYASELTDTSPADIVSFKGILDEDGSFGDYAQMLVLGVEDNLQDIDKYLIDASKNWALSRMSIVDRSILRMAVYEMIYVKEVPLSVSINEAVELAKGFGGEDDSHRFVNGVLGQIARRISDVADVQEG